MLIRTNNVPRDLINAWELTEREQRKFDYLDWPAIESGNESATFFRYRGRLHDLSEFSRVIPQGSPRCHPTEGDNPNFAGWDGYLSDSFFSGLLVRYVDDFERIVVGAFQVKGTKR